MAEVLKQMSREWIGDRLKDAVGKGTYDEIDRAMKHGDVGYQLVKVRKNGDIMINNLDKKANIIRPQKRSEYMLRDRIQTEEYFQENFVWYSKTLQRK